MESRRFRSNGLLYGLIWEPGAFPAAAKAAAEDASQELALQHVYLRNQAFRRSHAHDIRSSVILRRVSCELGLPKPALGSLKIY